MKKKTLLIIGALLLSTMVVSACENTWHGMGRDMENAGQTMQKQ